MHLQSFLMESDADRRIQICDGLNAYFGYLNLARDCADTDATLAAALIMKLADALAAMPAANAGTGRKTLTAAVERDLTMLLALMKAPENGAILMLPDDEGMMQ